MHKCFILCLHVYPRVYLQEFLKRGCCGGWSWQVPPIFVACSPSLQHSPSLTGENESPSGPTSTLSTGGVHSSAGDKGSLSADWQDACVTDWLTDWLIRCLPHWLAELFKKHRGKKQNLSSKNKSDKMRALWRVADKHFENSSQQIEWEWLVQL